MAEACEISPTYSYGNQALLTLIVLGVGGGSGIKKNFIFFLFLKFPCSHNDNTALIKPISLLDTALSHDKYLKFQFKISSIFTN